MARLWQQIRKSEQGQALPIVLVLLVLGGLLVTPSLDYAATSLNASMIVKQNMRGVYAADAGVEHVLWAVRNSVDPLPEQLPENVNQLEVAIETENMGNYALYYGGFVETGGHYDYLAIDKEIAWIEEEEAYRYTITVIWQPDIGYETIHLREVGVRLPIGYSYQTDSAASFVDNLSIEEPDDTLDGAGAHMLGWVFRPPRPAVTKNNPIETQAFYITGEGELEDDYAWIQSVPEVIDVVSEVSGTLYSITATATRPGDGEVMAEVTADVLWYSETEEMHIILWHINPPK